MAQAPAYKVYGPDGTYQAACKEREAAAALVAFYGDGARIKYQHGLTVWLEGSETIPANESYDTVSETIRARVYEAGRAALAKAGRS